MDTYIIIKYVGLINGDNEIIGITTNLEDAKRIYHSSRYKDVKNKKIIKVIGKEINPKEEH